MSPRLKVLISLNPATGQPLGEAPNADQAQVLDAVQRARLAFPAWRDTPPAARARLFKKLRKLVYARRDAIADLLTTESGKPYPEALAGEILGVLDLLGYYAKRAPGFLADRPVRHANPVVAGKRCYVRHEPLGVFAAIAPWNYPFSISMSSMLGPLIAGNTVVMKPSELTPLVGLCVGELFRDAGFPEGVAQVVTGDRDTGRWLVDAPVAGVVFTGSVGAGKAIMGAAAGGLKRCCLELGGKDAFIVLDDAPLEWTARGCVWTSLMNAGQTCASAERIYVPASREQAFTDAVLAEVARVQVGAGDESGVQMGPMISEEQRGKVEAQVADAVAKGARVLAGGKRLDRPGFFYPPTVLAGVTIDMDVYRQETFGPLIPIVPYRDEDEVVAMANDSPYGLAASVWTSSPDRGERLAGRLDVGTVWVNDSLYSYGTPEAPWGGVKDSGYGRTHGLESLLEFVNVKFVSVDRAGGRGRLWWYPYSREYLDFLHVVPAAMYGSALRRVLALPRTARTALRLLKGK